MTLALMNLVAAAVLCGLIWTIQLVHYPLFARVPVDGWTEYERAHQSAITPLVLPVMVANVGLGLALALAAPAGTDGTLLVVNAAIATGQFVATGLAFAPIHGLLGAGWDEGAHRRLVRLNWARTAAWTAQTAVACVLVSQVA